MLTNVLHVYAKYDNVLMIYYIIIQDNVSVQELFKYTRALANIVFL